jgi:hypothetical protein
LQIPASQYPPLQSASVPQLPAQAVPVGLQAKGTHEVMVCAQTPAPSQVEVVVVAVAHVGVAQVVPDGVNVRHAPTPSQRPSRRHVPASAGQRLRGSVPAPALVHAPSAVAPSDFAQTSQLPAHGLSQQKPSAQ